MVAERKVLLLEESRMSKTDGLPADYEQCATCGFDHEYEPDEAYRVHNRIDLHANTLKRMTALIADERARASKNEQR